MKKWTATIIITCSLSMVPAAASVDLPLTWRSVHIHTDEFGGAELRAAVDEAGDLDQLELTIRGRQMDIPAHCLQGLVKPYLNGISLEYGQTLSGQGIWSIEVPFDGTGSVELESTFNLVFSDTELFWSYQSIQIDDRTWEDRDVCQYRSE